MHPWKTAVVVRGRMPCRGVRADGPMAGYVVHAPGSCVMRGGRGCVPPATKRRVACQQALDGFVPDEAECRELVHALSGAASPEAGPSSEGGALLVGPPI